MFALPFGFAFALLRQAHWHVNKRACAAVAQVYLARAVAHAKELLGVVVVCVAQVQTGRWTEHMLTVRADLLVGLLQAPANTHTHTHAHTHTHTDREREDAA